MPQGNETLTVKKMKAEIAKKRQPKGRSLTTSEVVNVEGSHSQPTTVDNSLHSQPQRLYPYTTPEVVQNAKKEHKEVIYKEYLKDNLLVQLRQSGLTDDQIASNLEHLVAAYQAEGLTPNPDRLVDEILQLARVG